MRVIPAGLNQTVDASSAEAAPPAKALPMPSALFSAMPKAADCAVVASVALDNNAIPMAFCNDVFMLSLPRLSVCCFPAT